MALIRIDELPATALPTLAHVFPAMAGGVTHKIEIEQLIALLEIVQTSQNLDDLANADAALGNLGLSADAIAFVKAANYAAMRTALGATATGNALFTAATEAAARTAIKAGLVTGAPSSLPTAGTTLDITGIPAGVQRATLNFEGASMQAGNDNILVQLGSASGVEATGYSSGSSGAVSAANGMIVYLGAPARSFRGIVTLTRETTGAWRSVHVGSTNTDATALGGGTKTALAAEFDRVRVMSSAGNFFDSGGTVSLSLEF